KIHNGCEQRAPDPRLPSRAASGGGVKPMVDEQDVGLVGRDETVALIELLVERRRQPLPIVVASGPGGSGKTALLDHLQMRYRMAPMARIDLDTTGSTSVR